MTNHSNEYTMDMDWLWGTPPGNDGTPATVRLTVRGANARQAVLAWFEDLATDQIGVRGRGGWMVQENSDVAKTDSTMVVVDIVAGGEDVADAIEDATTEAFEVLDPLGVELSWENLPRI